MLKGRGFAPLAEGRDPERPAASRYRTGDAFLSLTPRRARADRQELVTGSEAAPWEEAVAAAGHADAGDVVRGGHADFLGAVVLTGA